MQEVGGSEHVSECPMTRLMREREDLCEVAQTAIRRFVAKQSAGEAARVNNLVGERP